MIVYFSLKQNTNQIRKIPERVKVEDSINNNRKSLWKSKTYSQRSGTLR